MANKIYDVCHCANPMPDDGKRKVRKLLYNDANDTYTYDTEIELSTIDLTGMVGVKRRFNDKYIDLKDPIDEHKKIKYKIAKWYEGHFYTFLDKEGTRIAHSWGTNGFEVRKMINSWYKSTYYYLKLRSFGREKY